ncbi:MAG: peptidoglycan-associated lipoprotein Pal [Nitrospirae bacterium]|nr:peptidoglycan-associated lipoprotein Pal [Nitrospirota bacterium]
MRRLFITVLIIMGIVSIAGCSTKRILPPDQSAAEQTEEKKGDKKAEADAAASKEPPKESITEKQLSKAQPSDSEMSIKELQTKIKDIHFDYDKYDIRDDAKPVMKEVADALSKNRKIKVIIEGHCDERGTNEYNLGLGDRRASSTKEYLVSLGIPTGKIETISYGEEKPLCAVQTEDCWNKNRRGHFVLVEENRK